MSAEDCEFGYRDSVFKHDLYENALSAIGFEAAEAMDAEESIWAVTKHP